MQDSQLYEGERTLGNSLPAHTCVYVCSPSSTTRPRPAFKVHPPGSRFERHKATSPRDSKRPIGFLRIGAIPRCARFAADRSEAAQRMLRGILRSACQLSLRSGVRKQDSLAQQVECQRR